MKPTIATLAGIASLALLAQPAYATDASSSFSYSTNSSYDSSAESSSAESSGSSEWSYESSFSSESSSSEGGCYWWMWWCYGGSSSSSSYDSSSSSSDESSFSYAGGSSDDSSSSSSESSDGSSSSDESSFSSSSDESSNSSDSSGGSESSESSNSSQWIRGCTDPRAANYDSSAEEDDGSCYCAEPEGLEGLGGCTHPDAENYDPDAQYDDGSCTFALVCSIGTPDPSDDITPAQPTNMCGGTMNGTMVGIFGTIAGAFGRLNNLEKSCQATWDAYETAMPGVKEEDFMKRCRHYSHHCNSFAANHTNIPDGPWGDANEGAMRHRCVIAGLACEFGQDVAEMWGGMFEVYGGDCDFANNQGKCPPITLNDHTTWTAGDPAEEAALADSCRDMANNDSAIQCMNKMCASYYTNGTLLAEPWHPLVGKVKVCCEATILGKDPPRNLAGTCSKHHCEKMAEGIAMQEKDVYELYEKVPGPPKKYVLGIMPATKGGFCAGY